MSKYKDEDEVVTDDDLADFLGPDLDPSDPDDQAELEDRIEDWFSK